MEILFHLLDFFGQYGYCAVFLVLLACGFGLPVPEDISLIAGGVICALTQAPGYHHLNVHIMVVVALVGVLSGDSVMFSLGSKLGPRVTRVPLLRRIITPNVYARIQEKAHRYGDKILFIARFLPGLRAPIFVTAGMSHRVSLLKFLCFDGSAALISVPLWIYVGFIGAGDLEVIIFWARKSEVLVLIGVALIVAAVILVRKLKKLV